MNFTVAIDGPAASGKGTLAKRLAAAYGLPHLDTGLLYRATARVVLDAGAAIDDRAAAVGAAQRLDPLTLDETRPLTILAPEPEEFSDEVAGTTPIPLAPGERSRRADARCTPSNQT